MTSPAVREPIDLVPSTPDGQPWERLKGESRQAFGNFVVYRDMGPERSMRKVALEIGKSIDTLKPQSVKYRWQDRIDAYELYLDRRQRAAAESERDRVNSEGVLLFRRMWRVAGQRLAGDADAGVTKLNANDLDAADVVRMIDIGWRGQRTATGQPTDVIKNWNNISSDDLLRIVNGLYEIAETLLPDERKPMLAARFQAFLDRGGS